MTLGQVFDPRRNALNAMRLVMASGVILYHSWPLTGHPFHNLPAERLLGEGFVDGFFTLSGFLITASWLRHPSLREFWTARALRIFPGLWICVLVTAFVLAPVAALIQHRQGPGIAASFGYVLNNGVFNAYAAGIEGSPAGIPWPHVWNGSLWTLFFEMLCYLMVSILGVTGMLKRQWTIPALFVLAVGWSAYVSYPTFAMQTWPQMLARFAVVFLAGALMFQLKDRIPAAWWLVAGCALVVVASGLLPNYRPVGALPLAYTVIVSGALLKRPNLKQDVSYGMYIYAFPVQQLLAVCGLVVLGPPGFFVIATLATLPLAAGSWFFVEKRAMRLKNRLNRKVPAGAVDAWHSPPESITTPHVDESAG
jgi:peptidoglycan/LPS O-acetylase OafA/YrhL